MRSNEFPLTIEVDSTVYAPAMLASFEHVTQVWAEVDGERRVVASGPALASRDRAAHGSRMANGTRARWAAVLADGTTWTIGHHGQCCSCRRHPLCGFVPPEPADVATTSEPAGVDA